MLIPVVLSGGSGTRLWPLSRDNYPKQFHALTGGPLTLFQETLQRMQGLSDVPSSPTPLVVCNANHRFMAAEQLRQIGVEGARVILEPTAKNTAPAMTLAALLAASTAGPDAVLLVMPSDHVIAQVPAFHAAVRAAYALAQTGAMCTFGIVPTRAETGFGYIEAPVANGQAATPRHISRFVEKPDAATAQAYLSGGQHLWNSGLFMVRASVWLKALEVLQPAMLAACTQAMQACTADLDFVRPQADAFDSSPADSIDYAVMEHLPRRPDLGINCQVVPLNAGWSDLGAWDAIWQALPQDHELNAIQGYALLEDCTGSLVMSDSKRLVAGIGLQHMVVVDTPDAVLVAPLERAQDVKRIVARLKASGTLHADTHRKVLRPWGWYDSIDHGDRFQVKRIVVKPGASLSLQMHHHRAEHWIVVSGTAEVTNGDKTFLLAENESTYIPLGHHHRLSNPGKVPLEIIEVQSGSYLGEDDIVRFNDVYGRA